MNNLRVVGTDGEMTNTGSWNGIVRRLEEHLDRPLQRVVCLIHMNELPLKRVMQQLVGKSSGTRSYHGKLGGLIEKDNLETLELVHFTPVKEAESYFPIFREDYRTKTLKLRTDQDYLYQMCHAVIAGPEKCSEKLLRTPPGEIGHARWLTTANRILRLYISTEKPEEIPYLRQIVHYIVCCYAPIFFAIRNEPNIASGAKHYFKMIELSRNLAPEVKVHVEKVVMENSAFAHWEHVLLSMLCDTDEQVKNRAIELIISSRNEANICVENKLFIKPKRVKLDREEKLNIRYFVVPKSEVNFDAKHYSELVNFDAILFEPPLTRGIEDISNFVSPKSVPCHTQDVERYVREVCLQSRRTCSEVARNGNIYVITKYRNKENEFKKNN